MAKVAARAGAGPRAPRRAGSLPLALAASLLAVVAGLGIVQQQREAQRSSGASNLPWRWKSPAQQLNEVQQKL